MLRPWCLALRACASLAGVALSVSFAVAVDTVQPVVPPDPEVVIGEPPLYDYFEQLPPLAPGCDIIPQEPGCLHHAGECAACQSCCSDCCCRLWTIRAEALIWDRVVGGGVPLVNAPVVVTTDDLDHDWAAGPRLTAIRHGIFGSCWDAEVSYFGIDGWSAETTLADIDDFQSNPPLVVAAGGGTIVYDSTLDSVEINLRRSYNGWLTWLVGFRHLQVSEGLGVDFDAGNVLTYTTNNHLWGGQVGLDAVVWDYGGPFYANLVGKAGIYGNSASSAATTDVVGVEPFVAANGDSTAFVGEIGLLAGYRLTDRLSIVGGYNVMWITDLALAPDQLATTDLTPPGAAVVSTDGTLFYHGVNVGLEYFW